MQCTLYRYSGRCMWSAACCMLHAVCCMLHVACCLLHVACCMLHAVCCLLHVACCLLLAACCKLSVACCYAACCRNAPAGRERVQCGHRFHERAHELKPFVRRPRPVRPTEPCGAVSEAKARVPEGEPHCFAYGRYGQFHRRRTAVVEAALFGKALPVQDPFNPKRHVYER